MRTKTELEKMSTKWLEMRQDQLFELGKTDTKEFKYIDSILDVRAEEMNKREEENRILREQEREEQHRKRIEEKYGDYDDWYGWATSHYEITPSFEVVSKTREWKEGMSWQCGSRYEALEKVEQLVAWREYDHFQRDIDGVIGRVNTSKKLSRFRTDDER